jgi:hypothetical protein
MMSIFWKFFDSCAIRIEKITKLFYKCCCKKREHNGHIKYGAKKSDFLDRTKMTCDPRFLDIIAYFCFI